MATNKYFPNFNYAREQDLVEDLVIESIKIHGIECRYLPRTIVKNDNLYGEDILSSFDSSAELEMYVKNVEGFEGEGDFLSKFNLEIRDELTLTVAKKRFEQIKTEKITTEVGYNLLQESANTTVASRQYISSGTANTDSIILEGYDDYTISSERPMEGDLIFFPLNSKLFEIKHVEHEALFYQTGRLQTYDLKCELFKYSDERLDTGNTEIDAIETSFSRDALQYQVQLEDGNNMLYEDGDSVIQEFRLESTDAAANNEFFTAQADSIIDFSEVNPFSEVDRY